MDYFSQDYCRFCLKQKSRRVKLHKINKKTEESFYDLTHIQLSNHLVFSKFSCNDCTKDLEKCIHTKRMFTENQSELEKKAMTGFSEIVQIKTETFADPIIFSNSVDVKIETDVGNNDDFDFSQTFTGYDDDYNNDEDSMDKKEDIKQQIIEDQPAPSSNVKDTRKACLQCGSIVKNLVEHMKYTHNQVDKKFFCDQCKFACYFKHKMEIHVRSHIPREFRNLFSCHHCSFKCDRKDTMKKHVECLHGGERERNFQCEECLKCYYSMSQLNTHIKTVHRNIRDFECKHCGKKFYTVKDLNLHTPRHFDKKEKCSQCNAVFFTIHEVRSHVKRVHLPRTIPCDVDGCTRMFRTLENLKTHKKIRHEKRKDYVCVECGVAFAQYNTLKRHIDTVHRAFRVICPVENCGFSMKRKERFNRHLIKYHPDLDEQARENIIKNLKYDKEGEQQHVKEFICPDCGKVFTKYHNLKNHIKKGHVRKIYPSKVLHCPDDQCNYKNRRFRLKAHMIKHHKYTDDETLDNILKNAKYDPIETN